MLIWILIFSMLGLITAQLIVPAHKYKYLFIGAAFFSLILRFDMIIYLFSYGTDAFGTDGLTYHLMGKSIAEQLENGVSLFNIKYDYTWYSVFVGVIYHVFGVYRHMAAFINAFMALISGLVIFKIVQRQGGSFRRSSCISLLFLYFPNLLFWTSDTLKESLTIFILVVIWRLVQSITLHGKENGSIRVTVVAQIGLVCFFMWFSTLIRIYLIIPTAIGIILCQIIALRRSRSKSGILFLGMVIACSLVVLSTTFYSELQGYHAVPFPQQDTGNVVENIANKAEIVSEVASKRNIPLSFFNFLTLPHPTNVDVEDIKGMDEIISVVKVDMLLWYLCLLLAIIRAFKLIRNRDPYLAGMLAFIAVYIIINALLTDSNSRTAYRYRCQMIWPMLLVADWSMLKQAAAFCAKVFIGEVRRAGVETRRIFSSGNLKG